MRITILLAALVLHSFFLAAQNQPSTKGSLVYTLGKDTSAIGNFELNGNKFSLTVVSMSPYVNVSKLNGEFFPDGELMNAEGYNYDAAKGKDSVSYSYKLRYANDTTFIETKSRNRGGTRKYPVKIMVANSLGGDALVFMPALLASFAPAHTGDSVISSHIVFNSARKFIIKRTGNHKLLMGSAVMGMFTIFLDDKGKIRSVDGIGTSFNIKGTAGPYLDLDSVIAASVKRQGLHPQLGVINKPDSVKAVINTAEIKIIYSRPSVRGRVIFGEVVPWNRIWRTGADAATKITLSQPLYFAGKELPAGEYSIFTLPTQHGWTLIFNKQANIWGTEHNADYDLLKVPMTTIASPDTTEVMTIEVNARGNGGVITVAWDKLKASVKFSTLR